MTAPVLNVTLAGLGAIGRALLPLLAAEPRLRVTGVLVRPGTEPEARAALASLGLPWQPLVAASADALPRPGLLVECAGHAAITAHVLPALRGGVDAVVASVGALSAPGLVDELAAAAATGGARLQLLSGAIGAIDALDAARLGGLASVRYTGTKPARAWAGTPAEALLDLDALHGPTVFFDGSARDAAQRFPKNANVAATVALAGLGLDATTVRLVADPQGAENIHQVDAEGAFGRFSLTMVGRPLAANPKTSALTVYSLARAVLNRVRPVIL